MPLNKKQEASDTLPDASFLSVHNSARVSARLPIHDRTKRLALPARLSQYGMGLLSHC
ncbi:MAG: hypothetical protein HFJ90_08685 [Muribaculaceae bacterium]|nr:hypothetical protein [Muribaculaceae bacterium]